MGGITDLVQQLTPDRIFGSNHAAVTDGVTQASGLDTAKTTKLLMILAPIVLAAVAHHRSTTGASSADVLQSVDAETADRRDRREHDRELFNP